MRRTTSLLLLSVPLVVGLGACGDDDEPTASASASTSPSTDTVGSPDEVTVDIAEFAFSPQELEVAVGTPVVWTNGDDFAHTAEATDGAFDTGEIAAGASSDVVAFDETGTYSYFCAIHNSMTGVVTVVG